MIVSLCSRPPPRSLPRLKASLNYLILQPLVHHLASPSDKAKHFQPWKLTPRRLRQIRQLRQDPDRKRSKAYELHCSSDPVSASDERQLQPYRQRQPSQRQRQRQTTPTTPKQLRLRQVIEVWLKRDRVSATF